MVERKDDPDDEGFTVGSMAGVPASLIEAAKTRGVVSSDAPLPLLMPCPDKGVPFAEALDETMRDHRAVFAALAK